MAKERSKFVQFIAYLGIAFISILLALLFVGQDALSSCTPGASNQNLLANINGENIKIQEFLRYKSQIQQRYNISNVNDQLNQQIMNQYFNTRIINQLAKQMGFDVSDKRIASIIRKNYTDPKSKVYYEEFLKATLRKYNINLNVYYEDMKINILNNDFMDLVMNSITIPNAVLLNDYFCENSEIQIRYAFTSDKDLREKFKTKLIISDSEVEKHLQDNPDEVKDPKTDKERIRRKLSQIKYKSLKKDLVNEIATLSASDKGFSQAASLLNSKTSLSAPFKLGQSVKENKKNGKSLSSLSNSKIFLEKLLSIETGKTSPAIETATGIYIFTPIVKKISKNDPTKEELAVIKKRLKYQIFTDIQQKIFDNIISQNKIKMYKNLKTN